MRELLAVALLVADVLIVGAASVVYVANRPPDPGSPPIASTPPPDPTPTPAPRPTPEPSIDVPVPSLPLPSVPELPLPSVPELPVIVVPPPPPPPPATPPPVAAPTCEREPRGQHVGWANTGRTCPGPRGSSVALIAVALAVTILLRFGRERWIRGSVCDADGRKMTRFTDR